MPAMRSSSNSPHSMMLERKDERSPQRMEQQQGDNHRDLAQSYEEIMGISKENSSSGISSLASRLETFRKWLAEDAKIIVHPSLCIVNGEATDGTKNAPVMVFESQATSMAASTTNASNTTGEGGRIGFVDTDADRSLYDRTMGCQIRAARELRKDEVVMTVPISAMITPDLVAASSAGRAIQACCQSRKTEDGDDRGNFWNVFENTVTAETNCSQKVDRNTGTQLLVKILQERKRVESAFQKAMRDVNHNSGETEFGKEDKRPYTLAAPGLVSTRAPVLAFLIHQRFSNQLCPQVVAEDDELWGLSSHSTAYRIHPLPDSPSTFAPYARTLPSFVSLPICWKRNELALLAGCIPGVPLLQQAAAWTMQLAAEFIALLDAGILFRFPKTFPLGLITWERWVWAAAAFTSRILPSSCYLQAGESSVSTLPANRLREFQSSPEVWDELGVLVPFLDMLNHESDANQITWIHYTPESNLDGHHKEQLKSNGGHLPHAIVHCRVKKGAQLYSCYGHYSNQTFILQYGFAQMSNPLDNLTLGWGLADAIGNVQPPVDFVPPFDNEGVKIDETKLVFESADLDAINSWWSDERLSLFEKEVSRASSSNFMHDLKMGKKMTFDAHSDGSLDPFLISSAVVATMPPLELLNHARETKANDSRGSSSEGLALTRAHQRIIRAYIAFVFSRKLEKLLQNLNNGLKDHFSNLQLWTRLSQNGLRYEGTESKEDDRVYTGWQSFFDAHAYHSTIEVEKRYYSMSPTSCVLTLYDGHLRTIQASLDGISTWKKFEDGALQQLEDLGFVIVKDDDGDDQEVKDDNGDDQEAKDGNGDDQEVKNGIGDDLVVKDGKGDDQEVIDGNGDDQVVKDDSGDDQEVKDGNGDDQEVKDGSGDDQEVKDGSGDDQEMKDDNGDDQEINATMEQEANGSNNIDLKEKQESKASDGKQKRSDGKGSPSKSRRRNRRRQTSDRPPALKLHIGNLAYTTTPSDLYDYFAHMYGKANVLECHIPTERGTGRSRGFGFVTMPETVARKVTQSGRKHEIQGRFLKVAESNSAGASKSSSSKPVSAPIVASSMDRCAHCGYRPRYCVCDRLHVPSFIGPPGVPPPRMDRYDRGEPHERDMYHYGPGGGRGHNDRYSHSHSPSRRGSRGDRDRDYRRDSDRDYRHRRSSSYSDSGSRGRGRDRSRSDRRVRERSDSRSPPHHGRSGVSPSRGGEHKHSRGGSSRHSKSRSDSRERSRSHSYSDRREKRPSVGESLGDSGRGGAKVKSPNADPSHAMEKPRKRSRSRSRGKSGRKRSKKDSRRHERSPSHSDSYSATSDNA